MSRKIIAVTLLVSFIAMSTSGMMMFIIEKPSFSIQMHPVHKVFGLVMIVSVIGHLFFNYRSMIKYLTKKSVALYSGILVCMLVVLYGIAINNKIPENIAAPLDKLAEQAESKE